MKTIYIALLVAVVLLAATPIAAQASCSGFIDCWLGLTERTEVRNARMIETERIQAQRDADVARIEAEAQERVRQAEAEVERVRQQQYATEAQRDIAIAQAEQQAAQYRAMITALTDEKIAVIQANAQSQIVALQEQSKIAIEGITQTGRTERWRVGWLWAFAIVATLIVGAVVILALLRKPTKNETKTVVYLVDSHSYDVQRLLRSARGEIEVKHGTYTRKN